MTSILGTIRSWLEPRRADTRDLDAAIRAAMNDGYETGRLAALSEQWAQPYSAFDTGQSDTIPYSIAERDTYRDHSLMNAAVSVTLDLTLGTGVTYGTLDDEAAQEALEDWYALNDLETFSRVIAQQYLLDGELLGLIAMDASRNEPSWFNLWDTRLYPVTLNLRDGNPRVIDSISLSGRTVQPDGFAWRANDPLWNTQRGTPPVRTAVAPACAYSRLLELRVRAHEIRGRANAVYYAMAKDAAELERKAGRYKNLPRHGNVVTLQMNPETGQSEKLEMLSTRTDAADAEADIRAHVRTVAMTLGFPEHFLAIGDTGNRATAESMSEPMIRRTEGRQTLLLGFLAELFRKELRRRFGPERLYRVETIETDGLTRRPVTKYVTADELEIPFSLPPVRSENDTEITTVQYALEQNLISRQTATEELGFDPALEAERMAGDDSDATGGRGEQAGSGEFTDDARNQRRILNASTLADQANAADPDLGLHWAHILTADGAVTAPGAFLGAAMGGAAPAPSESEPPPPAAIVPPTTIPQLNGSQSDEGEDEA